jgi:hypothetical protein
MFDRLFKWGASRRKLRPDDVRGLVREFVDEWPPFHDRYGQAPDISVEWVKSADGHGTWVAGIIPALDIRCSVVVDDEAGQVIEAQMIAMRTRDVMASWRR